MSIGHPKEACTCGSLRKASRRITQFYDSALAPVGIKSTQFSILSEVDRGSIAGPVSMCELATAMVMDRSTLGHNLRPLERDDLLTLRLADSDRRKRHVKLTKKGRATLQRHNGRVAIRCCVLGCVVCCSALYRMIIWPPLKGYRALDSVL